MKLILIFLLLSMVMIGDSAGQAGGEAHGPCVPIPQFSSREDSIMFGRLAAAIEDLGGGYYGEARSKYQDVIKRVDKGNYHPCLRWMAYDGYGQALVATHKKVKALEALSRAADLAKTLSAREQAESEKHLEEARSLK